MGVGSFILPQMGGGVKEWQRPSDWLPMPTNITETGQIFVGLHAVIENSDNYCAFPSTSTAVAPISSITACFAALPSLLTPSTVN